MKRAKRYLDQNNLNYLLVCLTWVLNDMLKGENEFYRLDINTIIQYEINDFAKEDQSDPKIFSISLLCLNKRQQWKGSK